MTTTGTGTRRPARAAADLADGTGGTGGTGGGTGGDADRGVDGGVDGGGGRGAGGAESAVWDLDAEPGAASRARDLTRQALREWRVTDPGDVDDVVLIVDELVTNAVVHGSGPVRLALRLRGAGVEGEVRDAAAPVTSHGPLTGAAPAEPRVLDWAEAGRGLLLVAALATGYGARPEQSGKTVWFTRLLTPGDTISSDTISSDTDPGDARSDGRHET
ncbi:ATP-binding protein [Spirillospora sp. NBC_00431]